MKCRYLGLLYLARSYPLMKAKKLLRVSFLPSSLINMNMINDVRGEEPYSTLESVKFDETAYAPERDWLLAAPELDQS